MKLKVLILSLITVLITTGCVQESFETGHSRDDFNPEHETGVNWFDHLGPVSDLLTPDNGPGQLTKEGTQLTNSQRDYGWHKNRANAVKTGRIKDHPRFGDDYNDLRAQVETINQQYEGTNEDASVVKDKIEELDAVSQAHVVSHGGRLYIGIEGASMDDDQWAYALSSLAGDEDIVWHTDRRAVHRIRAAERTMNPNHEGGKGVHEWFEDVEFELQKLGDDWNN